MEPHQQRVVGEKADLDKRRVALRDFIDKGGIFTTLDHREQERLREQFAVMTRLSEILGERIVWFSTP